jgi:hypothetical protein
MALIEMDRAVLVERMRAYFDPAFSDEAVGRLHPALMMTGNEIDGPRARKALLGQASFSSRRIVRYPWKPLDTRFCYLDNIGPLFSRPSPELIEAAILPAQWFFITRDDSDTPDEGPPSFGSPIICDYDLLRGHARFFPAVLPTTAHAKEDGTTLQASFDYTTTANEKPNLSEAALAWTTSLGLPPDAETSRLVWRHALAVTYSPAYLAENTDGLRLGWPRIPLPDDAALLRASAALGTRLAALLDTEAEVPGVTAGEIAPALAPIAVPATAPGAARDWALRGWGAKDKRGAVMPGQGRSTARPYSTAEAATAAQAACLGTQTLDIGMNGASFWRNIPEAVWEARIGGYQVLKKWLSYRDHSILGRELTAAEVAHVQGAARRLAAIKLLGPELDASYRACAAAHTPLPAGT